MQIRVKSAQWPDFDRMQKTIRDAGFVPVPSHVELVVTGEIVRQDGRLAVALDGMSVATTLPLREAEAVPVQGAVLEQHLGQVVQLTGRWQPSPKGETGAGTLSVVALHPVQEKEKK